MSARREALLLTSIDRCCLSRPRTSSAGHTTAPCTCQQPTVRVPIVYLPPSNPSTEHTERRETSGDITYTNTAHIHSVLPTRFEGVKLGGRRRQGLMLCGMKICRPPSTHVSLCLPASRECTQHQQPPVRVLLVYHPLHIQTCPVMAHPTLTPSLPSLHQNACKPKLTLVCSRTVQTWGRSEQNHSLQKPEPPLARYPACKHLNCTPTPPNNSNPSNYHSGHQAPTQTTAKARVRATDCTDAQAEPHPNTCAAFWSLCVWRVLVLI